MKPNLCLYYFLCLSFLANGQAKIEFDSKYVDYGIAQQNSYPFREIGFTNLGNDTLIIKMVKTSCGCLVAYWPKEPFPPGESGKIRTRYDMRRIGKVNKTISIYSNSHDESRIVLKVKGTITKLKPHPKIEFQNTIFNFDTVAQGTIIRDIKFEFKNIGTDTLVIFDVKSSTGSLAPIWSRRSTPPKGEGVISAIYSTKGRHGFSNKPIVVSTNDSTNLVVPLFVQGFVKKKNQKNE